MARITLGIEDLVVTSFITGATTPATGSKTVCTADISTCSRTSVEGGCDTSVQCVSVPAAGC